MSYDFSKLTANEQWLLTTGGWAPRAVLVKQPSKKSASKLIARGLITERLRTNHGVTWAEYDVPLNVHMAWCASQG